MTAPAASTLDLALQCLEQAGAPRSTRVSPLRWADDARWKQDYCHVDRLTPDQIQQRRAEFDHGKAVAQRLR